MTEQPKHSAGCNYLDADPCSCGVNMNESLKQPSPLKTTVDSFASGDAITEQFEGLRTIDKPEQPNQNLMLIEQVKGCVKVSVGLLEQLKPRTDSVRGCIYKLKEWQFDYLRILQKAFE